MDKLYGRGARIFSGVISVFVYILIFSTQLKSIGEIVGFMFKGISVEYVILVTGLIIVTYTSVSGMRGVAYTDVLQFVFMVAMLFILTGALLQKVGGLKALIQQLPEDKKRFWDDPSLVRDIKTRLFFGVIPTFLLTPPIFQRILMVQNKRQVKYMFFSSSIIYSIVAIMLLILGLGAIVYKDVNPGLIIPTTDNCNMAGYLGNELFKESNILRIFLLVGMIFIL